MTTGHKIWAVCAVIVAVILGLTAWVAISSAIEKARLQEQTKANVAQVATIQQANVAVAKQRDIDNAAIVAARLQAKTTTQIVQLAPKLVPYAVHEVTPDEVKATNGTLSTDDIVVPAKEWADTQTTCKLNENNLSACTITHNNDLAIIAVKDKQIAEDQVALKGGTKWQRFRHDVKIVAIGAGIGAVAVLAARH